MTWAWVLLAWLAPAAGSFVTSGDPKSAYAGQQSFCDSQGRRHTLRYDTKLSVDENSIYEIDTLDGLKEVACDIDGSSLKLVFHDEIHSTQLYMKAKGGNLYLTGGDKHGCPLKFNVSKGFLLRRANGAHLDGQATTLYTSLAKYDEIYSDADINYGNKHDPSCAEAEGGMKRCVGVNADPTCTAASQPLPVYKNDHISLTCDNCFAALSAEIFFDLKISAFRLEKLQAGYKNATVHAAMDLDLVATASWSAGIDKTLPILGESNPIISFKIGPVPFIFWFDVNQRVQGSASLMATAEAKAGVSMHYDIGDNYISWDPVNHWTHIKPNPSVSFTPAVSGSASFMGTANFHLIPDIGLHVNQLFSYTLTLDPELDLQIAGKKATKSICETVTYAAALQAKAELSINIDWAHVHDDKTWGPTTIWDKSGTLSQHCVAAKPPKISGSALV